MIKIDKVKVCGFEEAIRGMRNSWNSWDKSDSKGFDIGEKDKELMLRLCNSGPSHSKFRRMIVVWMDITAPLYWWKEFDTYKVGTVANSCSTMHTIHKKEFTMDDFSFEYSSKELSSLYINFLNDIIRTFHKSKNKEYWNVLIEFLPSAYNQKRTIMTNYEVLSNIYKQRRKHKLKEWNNFCNYIDEHLPNSFLITNKEDKNEYDG